MDNMIIYVSLAIFAIVLGFVAYRRNPAAVMTELKAVAEMAVAAIEQAAPGKTNGEKLSQAIEWIKKTGKFNGISEILIRMAIEAAVKVIKYPGATFSAGAMLDTIETGMNPTPVEYHDAAAAGDKVN